MLMRLTLTTISSWLSFSRLAHRSFGSPSFLMSSGDLGECMLCMKCAGVCCLRQIEQSYESFQTFLSSLIPFHRDTHSKTADDSTPQPTYKPDALPSCIDSLVKRDIV